MRFLWLIAWIMNLVSTAALVLGAAAIWVAVANPAAEAFKAMLVKLFLLFS